MASMVARALSSSGVEADYIWDRLYAPDQDWRAAIDAAPLTSVLDRAVAQWGDRPAIECGGARMTYAELGALCDKIAAGLQKAGVKKGVKVGLFLPNSPYSVAFYYGILKAGGTVVNYNPLYAVRELASQIEDSETVIMVTMESKALMDKAAQMLSQTRLEKLIVCPGPDAASVSWDEAHVKYDALIANDGSYEPVAIDPAEDIAVLQYTGGTTGIPKGAMLTHANLYANTMQIAMWYKSVATPGQDVQVGVLPLFHVFAMTVVMNMSIWYGMEMVLVPKFDPSSFITMLQAKKPTFVPAVPTIYGAVAAHPKAADLDLSSIRFCMSGGAPLPGEIKRDFESKTGAVLGEGYGLTESSPVATCNPPHGKVKLGSIGLPIPGTLIEILSLEDGKTVLPQGETGEICIMGPQIMKGYYNKPEETAATIREGRLHTGDVGYIDEEGYVYLVDRVKDLVLVNGYNVYPRQVEEAIYMHSSVEECIVAGVPDAKRGETVWAWVKPLEGKNLSEQELKDFLKDKISPIEMPRKVVLRAEPLPKTAVGKLSRKLLLEEEGIKRG